MIPQELLDCLFEVGKLRGQRECQREAILMIFQMRLGESPAPEIVRIIESENDIEVLRQWWLEAFDAGSATELPEITKR